MISTQMARWRAKVQYQQKQRERRERIATAVLVALTHRNGASDEAARAAVRQADALIAELDK